MLDKLTYAGRRENLEDLDVRLVVGGIEDPAAVADAHRGRRRDRQLRRRDARRPLDRRARRVRDHPRARHLHAARGGPRARRPLRAGLHRRGLRLDRGGLVHRGVAARSRPRPYSATKAGADLLVASYRHTYGLETLICRGSNNYGPYQYPEKLIPLMVLNALHGDKLPVYGDGMQVRNWIYVDGLRARHRPRARARRAGRGLQRRRPGRVPRTSRSSSRSSRTPAPATT